VSQIPFLGPGQAGQGCGGRVDGHVGLVVRSEGTCRGLWFPRFQNRNLGNLADGNTWSYSAFDRYCVRWNAFIYGCEFTACR